MTPAEWLTAEFRADAQEFGVRAAAEMMRDAGWRAAMPIDVCLAICRGALSGMRTEPYQTADDGLHWLAVPSWALPGERWNQYAREAFWPGSMYGYPPASERAHWHEAMSRINKARP